MMVLEFPKLLRLVIVSAACIVMLGAMRRNSVSSFTYS